MEFKQLKYFIEIANQEHMTEAALTLNIAQSALSRQMSLLESELNVSLFKRQGRNIKLTEEGHLFLKEAIDILEAVERSKSMLSEEIDKDKHTLNISMARTDMTGKIMQTLKQFIDTEKIDSFSIVEPPTKELETLLDDHSLDVVISPVKFTSKNIRSLLLFNQNYKYVFKEHTAVNLPKNARMSEIVSYPLVTLNPILDMNNIFSHGEITNHKDITIVQHLLMSHHHVGIVSPEEAKLLKYYYPGLIDYSLDHLNINQPVYLSMRTDNKKPFAKRWFNHLRQAFQMDVDQTFQIRF
jgi:LysR family transcriptional activator of glutamate synthase operon